MHPTSFVSLFRLLTALVFAAAAVYYLSFSIHWRMSTDTPVMHYVIFLLRHGLRPYTEITDNNMPGAYLSEAAAMRLFGGGDVGWRLYEFALLGLMAGCMAWLARRVDPFAGLLAAGIFLALHASEGPQFAAERELVVTVLLLLATVAVFAAVERHLPAWMLAAGFCGGLAASIKPTFLLVALGLIGIAVAALGRERVRRWAYLSWAVSGLTLMFLACLGFLLWYHALGSFVFILTRVVPAYAGLQPPPWKTIVLVAIPKSLLALTGLTVPIAVYNWRRLGPWSWQRVALALCAWLGLLSFLAQRKGFPHHRYTFLSFLLLLVAIELFAALGSVGWPRALAVFCLLYALLGFIPRSVRAGAVIPAESQLYVSLRSDLRSLGGASALQNKVFCLDLVYGCLNALYHENIVENTGFTGDLLFFPPRDNPATDYYRERFFAAVQRNPPSVLVLSNEDLLAPRNNFDRLQRWPALAAYIAANFVQVTERTFAHEKFGVHQPGPLLPDEQDAYRIYLRKGSPLLAKEPELRR